jgi:hypothetical protein
MSPFARTDSRLGALYARFRGAEPAGQRPEQQPNLRREGTSVDKLMTMPSASPVTAPTATEAPVLTRLTCASLVEPQHCFHFAVE